MKNAHGTSPPRQNRPENHSHRLRLLAILERQGHNRQVWSTLDAPTIDAVVKAALDGGIDWFDTAELYGWGNSERSLSAGPLVKLSVAPGDGRSWPRNGSRSSARRVRLLRHCPTGSGSSYSFPIDLLQIHSVGWLSSVEKQAMALAKLL